MSPPPVDVPLTIAADLEQVLGVLADIGFSEDMTLEVAQKKAKRFYALLRGKYPIDVKDVMRQYQP